LPAKRPAKAPPRRIADTIMPWVVDVRTWLGETVCVKEGRVVMGPIVPVSRLVGLELWFWCEMRDI
jgi:hypothetical protein